jgi:transcriptional regulator with XRE-family HTH domain
MKFQDLHHDEAVLQELGRRVTQVRIDLDLSQAELAKQAGIGKRTLERLESGETTQTRTLFRIFRELGLLGKMEVLLPEPTTRPSHMIKDTDALPRRVPRKKTDKAGTKEWKWGDES